MRVSSTASATWPGPRGPKPGASTASSCGMKKMPSPHSSASHSAIKVASRSASCRATAGPWRVSAVAKAGTKAALNAPSPNSRRNRLGNLRATKKASAIGPAPSFAAIRMSRMKPRIRLSIVQPPTVAMARNIAKAGRPEATSRED